MPSLGADMESGKLVQWLVKPGSAVKKGDVIAVVETHKGAFEIDIFQDGVVSELCAKEGDELPVGAVLAHVAKSGEEAPKAPRAPPAPGVPSPEAPAIRPAKKADEATELPSAVQPSIAAPPPRAKVTPAARRRAGELGIEPDTLQGTGIDGSVTLADVELAAAKGIPAKAPSPTKPAVRPKGFDPAEMRQAIAAAMSRSKREIPHYYMSSTIDMSRPLAWLENFNSERTPEERLLPAVLLLKATALALREHSLFNGFWKDGRFRPADDIHIGWAIALRGGGLIAPAIHEADKRSLPKLMAALRDLVTRARGGGIRGSEMMDPTCTVTSLGDRGAESVLGVIYPPQVAILGFGQVLMRPWVRDGNVVARQLITASLAADHRASDGHAGGLFLTAIDRILQDPESL
jgi:pyruvate dehydrogenase E2 component (dihydrolipoamide acetyltransferase)